MTDARPAKKVKRSAPPPARTTAKRSNRPRNSPSPSPSPSEDSADDAQARAIMLEQLEAHQRALLADVLPRPPNPVPTLPPQVVKPIWEMGEDDFEQDDNDDDDDDSEEDKEEYPPQASTSGPIVLSFQEPRATATAGSQRDMLAFMSAKVKNARPTFSVADLVNVKPFSSNHRHKQRATPATIEDEAHLSSLDSALSSLIRPLASPATQSTHNALPSLLSSLPLAPTKLLKGLTPLPANAPRTLRRGQMAANLDRARKRDESNGILAGAKRGREATTLKESRKDKGEDKRQRGLGGAVGKMTRGGLVISQADVERIGGASGARGARGGTRGRGASRGASRGRAK